MAVNGNPSQSEPKDAPPELTCGIVMPISTLDGCSAEHWSEVLAIIKEAVAAISTPRFVARLVSDANEIGVIQKRIVQSLYNDPIVVCDVSCKNPNVMFELGLRLAFDKPTVIIKDDQTSYSFDTGIIEHVPYPRDLRFHKVVDFKTRLAAKIAATYQASLTDKSHSPFLKNFGQFTVAAIDQKEVPANAAILAILSDMQQDLAVLKQKSPKSVSRAVIASRPELYNQGKNELARLATDFVAENPGVPLVNKRLLEYIRPTFPADSFFASTEEFVQAINDVVAVHHSSRVRLKNDDSE